MPVELLVPIAIFLGGTVLAIWLTNVGLADVVETQKKK